MTTDPDPEHHRRDPITYRHPTVVAALLGYTAEANDDGHKPSWEELMDHVTDADIAYSTAENLVYELCGFGALARHGNVRGRSNRRIDTRAFSITTLGRHWLAGTQPPPLIKEPT